MEGGRDEGKKGLERKRGSEGERKVERVGKKEGGTEKRER